jgi:RimJ/RimL family protein N-acetyltransferase
MTQLPTTYFETARLRARSFSAADVEVFVAYRADPDVARYQSWSDYTRERGEAFVESLRGVGPGMPGAWFQFALETRSDGTLVGDLALKVDADEPRKAEVGFTLSSTQQGKGYATEALRALLDYAFETFGLHRVVAVTDALNDPAAALLERVGMRREAHFVENIFFKGTWGSEFLFAILERERSQPSLQRGRQPHHVVDEAGGS